MKRMLQRRKLVRNLFEKKNKGTGMIRAYIKPEIINTAEEYRCIREFELPFLDDKGEMTNEIHKVAENSLWEYEPDYASNSEIRLYLSGGDSDSEYIDITYEILDNFFCKTR